MTHEQRAADSIMRLEAEYSIGDYILIARAELEDAIARGMAEASNAELERKRAVDWTGQVEAFMRAGGQYIGQRPHHPSEDVRDLRLDLLREEVRELYHAWAAYDIEKIADGVIDVLYVLIGMGLAFGLPMRELFAEVHRSNMAKAGPDGKFEMRADGKIMKPEGWQGPRIGEILRQHGAFEEAPR